MLSAGGTSVVGMLYWVLAAHQYAVEVVGINSALISAMTFAAGIAGLTLGNALIRFVPTTGRETRRLLVYSYVASATTAAALGLPFILARDAWLPALRSVAEPPWVAPWFVTATAAMAIFQLQDSALTGLRQTVWAPVENTLFGIAKIGFLLFLAAPLPNFGIFA